MNHMKLSRKLTLLYVFCVLLPLVVTDSILLYIVLNNESVKQKHAMENEARAIQYSLTNDIDYAAAVAKQIYMNEYIENYLNRAYVDALAYVVSYQEFVKTTLFKGGAGMDNTIITMYADNATIVNGGEFSQLSAIEDTGWYRSFEASGQDTMLAFYYDDERLPAVSAKRKVLFMKKLDFFTGNRCEKFLKIELDYSNMVRGLVKLGYEFQCISVRGTRYCWQTTVIAASTSALKHSHSKKRLACARRSVCMAAICRFIF